jgi:hypothetical protein
MSYETGDKQRAGFGWTGHASAPISPYLTAVEAVLCLRATVQGIYSLVKRGRLKPMPGRPGRLPLTREAWDRYLSTRRRWLPWARRRKNRQREIPTCSAAVPHASLLPELARRVRPPHWYRKRRAEFDRTVERHSFWYDFEDNTAVSFLSRDETGPDRPSKK